MVKRYTETYYDCDQVLMKGKYIYLYIYNQTKKNLIKDRADQFPPAAAVHELTRESAKLDLTKISTSKMY